MDQQKQWWESKEKQVNQEFVKEYPQTAHLFEVALHNRKTWPIWIQTPSSNLETRSFIRFCYFKKLVVVDCGLHGRHISFQCNQIDEELFNLSVHHECRLWIWPHDTEPVIMRDTAFAYERSHRTEAKQVELVSIEAEKQAFIASHNRVATEFFVSLNRAIQRGNVFPIELDSSEVRNPGLLISFLIAADCRIYSPNITRKSCVGECDWKASVVKRDVKTLDPLLFIWPMKTPPIVAIDYFTDRRRKEQGCLMN